ncbi:MAG TPA: alpha/beta fold hydrolase [Acidiferrobacterales bacterium]
MTNQALIDKYLPEHTFSEFHDIVIDSGSIEDVYEIARDVDLSKSSIIPLLFRLRGLPTKKMNALGFISAMGFSNIEETFPTENLVGYWKTKKIEPVSDRQDFINKPIGAKLKVGFSFQFAKLNSNQVKVSTETRVLCIGPRTKFTYAFYWFAIRPFSGLIRKEILRIIKHQAELCSIPKPPSAMSYPKHEMVAKIPAFVLFPLRIFYQIVGRALPRVAVFSFKSLLSSFPRKPLNPKEREFLKTATPLTFQCGDTVLAGYSFGEGPVILMVHGLLGSAANFRTMIPSLVEHGFRVIAFDSANHGNSPDGVAFSNRSIKHLEEVINQLGDIHAIISHSAGTYLVMMALLNFPASYTLQKCVYMAAFPDAKGTLLTFMDYFWVPKNIYPELCRWFEEIGGGTPFEKQSLETCLPRHRTPGKPSRLFIHDKDDKQIPFVRTQEMLAGDPTAELFVTQGLEHFKILREEKVIGKIVDFLKQ